jgi:quinol monooxygenase YgiN
VLSLHEMVRLTVVLRASARDAQALVDALRFTMGSTRLERGCAGCTVRIDPDSSVHYEEEWTTETDIRRHIQSDRFVSLLNVIESAQEPPRVQFDFLTASRGLDYVMEVRNSGSK